MKSKCRCINIDWLEVYVHEPNDNITRDAEYFRTLGFDVTERAYGTRQYNQMFTINDTMGEGWIEVRRDPKGLKTETGFSVLDEGSAHIRFCNRTCYAKHAAQIMIDFLYTHKYILSRISRLDICLDFEKFDSGDDPQKFLDRYLRGVYSKVNQGNISAHGKDQWDGRFWNSLSWGAEKSMITTKFYNKTMELKQKKDKPYIRQAWAASGLVDDMVTLEKRKLDGDIYKPDIWRLEFSISSSVKNWVCFDVDTLGNKTHLSKRNDLSIYLNRESLVPMFASLVNHYFHFKKFQEGVRKDRCEDKTLFDFAERGVYRVEKPAAAKADCKALISLKQRIENYRYVHFDESIRKACDIILNAIDKEMLSKQASVPTDATEIALLRLLLSYNIKQKDESTKVFDKRVFEKMLDLETEIF